MKKRYVCMFFLLCLFAATAVFSQGEVVQFANGDILPIDGVSSHPEGEYDFSKGVLEGEGDTPSPVESQEGSSSFIVSFFNGFFNLFSEGFFGGDGSNGNVLSATCKNVSQYGVTWTFDKEYDCGQYINGDWWVVGPVTIESVSPSASNGRNGMEVNPSKQTAQGFDSRAQFYDSSLVPSLPLKVFGTTSIVKVISDPSPRHTQYVLTASVLTIEDEPPKPDAFRPNYFGENKYDYFESNIVKGNLPSLNLSNKKSLEKISQELQRVQMTHTTGPGGDQVFPRLHTPWYSADFSSRNALSILGLFGPETYGEKREALLYALQDGIDKYGYIKHGAKFRGIGGFNQGRKLPLVFAAVLFNDQGMKDVLRAASVDTFAEDDNYKIRQPSGEAVFSQHFVSVGAYWNDLAQKIGGRNYPDPYGWIDGGKVPGAGFFAANYNGCCLFFPTKYSVLAARLLPGGEDIWGNEAPFLFAQRYTERGVHTQRDPCAPLNQGGGHDGASNYCRLDPDIDMSSVVRDSLGRVTSFTCQAGKECGRFVGAHGGFANEGGRKNDSAEEMWRLYWKSSQGGFEISLKNSSGNARPGELVEVEVVVSLE